MWRAGRLRAGLQQRGWDGPMKTLRTVKSVHVVQGRALGFIGQHSVVRHWCNDVVHHPVVDGFILLVILVNAVMVAYVDPTQPNPAWFEASSWTVFGIFVYACARAARRAHSCSFAGCASLRAEGLTGACAPASPRCCCAPRATGWSAS